MNAWLEHALAVLRMLANYPASPLGWVVFASATLGVAFILLWIMGVAVGNPRATGLSNLIVLVLVSVILLAGLTAGRVYLHPLLGDRIAAPWLDAMAAAATILLIATPLMCLLQRVRYITALVSLVVAGAAAAFVFLLVLPKAPGHLGAELRRQANDVQQQISP